MNSIHPGFTWTPIVQNGPGDAEARRKAAAVFGIPDPQWSELVIACVVLKQEKADHPLPANFGELQDSSVEFSETELPKSGSGKVLKRILRERFYPEEVRKRL